ncbi:hypothetical protein ACP70R_032957 [Stipagrostis hirtigluma subsp. patula]
MALRLHRLPLVAISLLLLAAAAAMGQQQQQGEKRVGMTMRYADEEESRWLDRWAETHEPLGSGRPMTVQPATEEESRWLNRMSANDKKAQESHRRGSGDGYLEFEADNPYVRALEAWVSRLIKQHGGPANLMGKNLLQIFRRRLGTGGVFLHR